MSFTEAFADAPEAPRHRRETVGEMAARLDLALDDAQAIIALTGMLPGEIAGAEITDDGPVIATTDGVRMVWRSESNPDAAGNRGLLLLARPDGRTDEKAPPYDVPVFVPAVEDDEPDPAPVKPAARKPAKAAKAGDDA